MNQLSLKCKCGTVKGSLNHVSPSAGNHVKCFCNDCQSFANHIAPEGGILDECGGTEVFQTAPWNLAITEGIEHVQCLRLTRKGLNRWYTKCCNTPIGNTLSADVPFLGLIHNFIDKNDDYEALVGPVVGFHKLDQATGNVPKNVSKKGMPLLVTLKVLRKILKWKLIRKGKKNPFFTPEGRTISKPIIIKS